MLELFGELLIVMLENLHQRERREEERGGEERRGQEIGEIQ
jgi:hypothetical protein